MIFGLRGLELWHQTEDFKVQNGCFEEESCFVERSEDLVAQSSVVEYDHDDETVFLKVFEVCLLGLGGLPR